MVTGSERLGPLTAYTANCRPVLSSERAPHRHMTANFRQQHSDRKYLIASPTRVLDTKAYLLTVSRKMTSTSLKSLSDYTANCRPVLSSERAPHRYKTAKFRQEIISGRKSHKDARYRDILTDCPTVSRKITSPHLNCRPVLSSEVAFHRSKTANFRQQHSDRK
jgi:hypothetical protein